MNSMTRLLEIMRLLRDPENGCPWDQQQDFTTIAPYTLEEAYEVVDAIEQNDMKGLCGELGDLLFQVVYHAQMASEQGLFSFNDVVDGIVFKLVNRHPHVFADAEIDNAEQQSRNWENIKTAERTGMSRGEINSILDHINFNLPALMRAQKLQHRAAVAGFDWTHTEDVLEKFREEFEELRTEIAGEQENNNIKEEMGDILFTCVNLCRHLKVEAESVLRAANNKFENRFRYIEAKLGQQGTSLEQASLEEMEKYWQEAKINKI